MEIGFLGTGLMGQPMVLQQDYSAIYSAINKPDVN
jgi:3-hydroxyisobutyrate dehydrogenase-like beta-hydroxyacid dehydrogenase